MLTLQARYLSGYSRVPDLFPSDEFIVIFGVFFSFSHKLICRGITPMKQPIGQCGTTCNQWYPPLASKPPFRGVRSQPCLTPETPNHPPFFGAQVRSQRSLGQTSGTCHGRHGRHCWPLVVEGAICWKLCGFSGAVGNAATPNWKQYQTSLGFWDSYYTWMAL